jgi:hypothetical protein
MTFAPGGRGSRFSSVPQSRFPCFGDGEGSGRGGGGGRRRRALPGVGSPGWPVVVAAPTAEMTTAPRDRVTSQVGDATPGVVGPGRLDLECLGRCLLGRLGSSRECLLASPIRRRCRLGLAGGPSCLGWWSSRAALLVVSATSGCGSLWAVPI